MIRAGDSSLRSWIDHIAERQPTPGGGAAAATAAALGAAAAAMAAVYTTGERWPDQHGEALALHEELTAAARSCLALADTDQQAYLDLQETWRDHDLDEGEVLHRQDRAKAIPVSLLKTCLGAAERCAAFAPRCNPQIVSDLRVGIHLLAGAARAAWQTFLVNRPRDDEQTELRSCLERLASLEADALGAD